MKVYIVILRGINVAGKNKLPMQELRTILNDLNFFSVKTYIQSGNIILKSNESRKNISDKIKEAIDKKYDYDVPVIIRTMEEWQTAIDNNPYKEVDEKQQYFTFLSETSNIKSFEVNSKEDELTITNAMVYVNAVGGYGKTKLTNNLFEKKLNVIATTRNLKTTLKLFALAKEIN